VGDTPQGTNRVGDVMISTFASNAVHRGFKLRSGQTIVNEISVCCFSAKKRSINEKEQSLGIRIMCLFYQRTVELAQSKPITHVGLVQREHRYNHLSLKLVHI
jgi:hypothetical protein